MQRVNSNDSLDTTETNDTFPEVDFISENYQQNDQDSVTEFRKLEMQGLLEPEPLLKEDKSRFVLFPIQHSDVS